MSDEGSREMATPCFVPKHHDAALKGEQCGEYPCKDVDIAPVEVGLGSWLMDKWSNHSRPFWIKASEHTPCEICQNYQVEEEQPLRIIPLL